jgi:cytidylate kinase
LFTIAIDGPAGSGKSTTAKRVASELGFYHLDTGAMYRAITYLALEVLQERGAEHTSEALTAAAREVSQEVELEFSPAREPFFAGADSSMQTMALRLFAGGVDITEQIRSAEVSSSVSTVAAEVSVRVGLVSLQRKFGERFENIVAEGRDIGTVVFPKAELKVYLDADLKERARRRAKEMNASGMSTTVEEQIEEIAYRDEYDSTREASPLTQAADAVKVDTSGMTIDDQVEKVLSLVKDRQAAQNGN